MQVSGITHHAPPGKSDCYLDFSKPKERFENEKVGIQSMRNHLKESNWEEEYLAEGNVKSIEDLWCVLKTKLLNLRTRFMPKGITSGKPSWNEKGSFPIRKQQGAIRNKHNITPQVDVCKRLRRRWSSSTKLRNKAKTMIRQVKRGFEKRVAPIAETNAKAFWAHIKRRSKTKSGVAPLLENDNDKDSTMFRDEEKAQHTVFLLGYPTVKYLL